ILRVAELPNKSYPHGMAYDRKRNQLLVVFTRFDMIQIFDADSMRPAGEILFSDVRHSGETYRHHINDVCVWEDDLYVSMFSETGKVSEEVFDGAILQYDLPRRKKVKTVIGHLSQPHSVKVFDGKLYFLDSLKGNFRDASGEVLSSFSGFVRGLDFDGRYWYVGQSVNRYISRMQGVSNNISMDSGIIAIDAHSKASRFLQVLNIQDINTISICKPSNLGEGI
ncbi:MAG: DUF4915 domain-containing protein, partial [Candidatus Omnitrophica bacterium]|nr:DUF4915 domain-containing protein [Candidatus Omnitrophota bacterium]